MGNETIKSLRTQAGLSQEQLASRAGVTKSAVSQWENGRASLSGRNLLNVAEALGVDPKTLLSGAPQECIVHPEERRIIELLRTLSDRERKAVIALLSALSSGK